jgi:hypothetical protein
MTLDKIEKYVISSISLMSFSRVHYNFNHRYCLRSSIFRRFSHIRVSKTPVFCWFYDSSERGDQAIHGENCFFLLTFSIWFGRFVGYVMWRMRSRICTNMKHRQQKVSTALSATKNFEMNARWERAVTIITWESYEKNLPAQSNQTKKTPRISCKNENGFRS